MNKKIIISLAVISAAAALAIGGTIAYFNDSEISSGNKFTAGVLDLTIDSQCHYNGNVCVGGYWEGAGDYPVAGTLCNCTWLARDLDGYPIVNFSDVKPGDEGESTISIHIDNNPAWVCAEIYGLTNAENGCNEPEQIADLTCGNPGTGDGELQEAMFFDVWRDYDCQNDFDQDQDEYLVEGAEITDLVWPIADSTTGNGAVEPGVNFCLAFAWRVSAEAGNKIQSDSIKANIVFRAVQERNNTDFTCLQAPICLPSTEVCDSLDNDCDGEVDEGGVCLPWINEFHYDNTSIDQNESVEIAGPAEKDIAGWSVVFYNSGTGGMSYRTLDLFGVIPDQGGGFGTLWFGLPQDGIQNGPADGFALVAPDNSVVQFLSYEGTFTATNGPANGMTSVDVGVSENGAEPVNWSLQLQGTGNEYSDFYWMPPALNSYGSLNGGQICTP